jgi:hypothetical protein
MSTVSSRPLTSRPFASLGGNQRESQPKVLFEAANRYGRFALEQREFTPDGGPGPVRYYWLTRSKPGAKPTGVSVRVSEMRALIQVFERIVTENDGVERGGR